MHACVYNVSRSMTMFSYYSIYTRKMLEHCNGGASMKEKERGKNETEKKGVKKGSNAGIEPATS